MEFALIDRIRARCAHARSDVRLGIGDDAALLDLPAGQCLAVSCDTLVDGVHFPKDTAPEAIGWKALAVNLSDLAAMGAQPAWASLALTLPKADADWVDAFATGFAELARAFDVALIGGDTTQGPLSITVTVHGFVEPRAALRRDSARVGDAICVTGTLGDAAAGLALRSTPHGATPALRALLERLEWPMPRVAAGRLLRGRARAAIDLSDGLVADLGHICRASGVGAQIDFIRLPTSPALASLATPAQRAGWQLAGGDDYELCFCVPPADVDAVIAELAAADCVATRIGTVSAGRDVSVLDAQGQRIEPPRAGWVHFE